ncbi:hypothetical protein BD410DRAFT_155697 [Rickenella mellea]|uniref:Uncharacterized protein n=1 Tax=Rickenella mellea TaxID=50990 RepID=A0A4Y7PHD1_9AGAM|nr:hypothetical protein BD410DRAFT_155697 [Rickenella mellea]
MRISTFTGTKLPKNFQLRTLQRHLEHRETLQSLCLAMRQSQIPRADLMQRCAGVTSLARV